MNSKLLNNQVSIPIVGFGTFGLNDTHVLDAFSQGFRNIDSASTYGNEEIFGQALAKSGLSRSEVFLTTKMSTDCQRKGTVEAELDNTLKVLGTDYADLYLIHWPVKEKFVDTWLTLEKIYHSGKVKAIGVSNFNIHHLEAIKKVWTVKPVLNQIELHPYFSQVEMVNYCHDLGIDVQAYSPLASGGSGLLQEPVLGQIAQTHGKSPVQVVLRWSVQRGLLTIPLAMTKEHMQQNLDIFNFELSESEMALINGLNKDLRTGHDPDTFTF